MIFKREIKTTAFMTVSFEIEVDGFVVECITEIQPERTEIVPLIINNRGSMRNIIDDLSSAHVKDVGNAVLASLGKELEKSGKGVENAS